MEKGTKCRTIVDTLSDEIAAGRYRPPSSFPSVERIIRRFHVAHLTAVKVLDELKRRGLVYSVHGSGTFVRNSAVRAAGPAFAAVVGAGSPKSDAALDLCRKDMDATIDDYAPGSGSLLAQTRRACAAGKPYHLFVLRMAPADAGDLEECVRLVREFDVRAAAVLFTMPGFTPKQAREVRDLCRRKSVALQQSWEAEPEPAVRAWFLRFALENGCGVDAGMVDAERADRVTARTQRLHDAKWGVFNHFLGYDCETAEEWNAKVDSFDVTRLADQLEACGAGYYFITLMQSKRWMCAPNATFDRIAGTKPGEACSRRDLPADIARELAKRGIALYLYFPSEGPKGDRQCCRRLGYSAPYGTGVTRPFVEKWASVLEEFSVRYGASVKGWWIASCERAFHHYNDDLLALYAQAARKGNPDALVASDGGAKPFYARYAASDDFTAGNFEDFFPVPPGRFIDGAQAHALIPLAAWAEGHDPNWGGHGLKRPPEYIADYVSLVNANGGVVTIDVHVNPDGSWDPDQFEALKVVGRRTGTLRANDKNKRTTPLREGGCPRGAGGSIPCRATIRSTPPGASRHPPLGGGQSACLSEFSENSALQKTDRIHRQH